MPQPRYLTREPTNVHNRHKINLCICRLFRFLCGLRNGDKPAFAIAEIAAKFANHVSDAVRRHRRRRFRLPPPPPIRTTIGCSTPLLYVKMMPIQPHHLKDTGS